MKRAAFKVHPDARGWLRTSIVPVNDKHEARFGAGDILMFAAIVVGMITMARLLIAH